MASFDAFHCISVNLFMDFIAWHFLSLFLSDFLRNFKRKIQLTSHNIKFSSTNRKIILFLYFRWILFRFDMAIVLNLRSNCFPIVNAPNEFFHDIQFYWDSKCIYETILVLKQFNRSNLRSIHSICWNL